MVIVNGRAVSDVDVLTITCYAVGAMVGRCAECIFYVSSLADCWFVFVCVCLGFINGVLLPFGHFMFFHDVAPIFCHCDGLILDYVLVKLVVILFMAPYGCTDFELAFCVCGLACLTRIGRELC